MINISRQTVLSNYFKNAGDFSIDFWFLCNGSYFEEDSDFDISIVSGSTYVFSVSKELIGSANYISLYDQNGYICTGVSLSNVLDGKFHHIALQLLKEQQSLRMFHDGIFYHEEPNVSFENLLYKTLLYISLFMILSTVSFVMLCSYSLMNDNYSKGELQYKLMEMKRKFGYALDSLTKPCKA